jgi:hypothetical protein
MFRSPVSLVVLFLTAAAPSMAATAPNQTALPQTMPAIETLPFESPVVVARWVEHLRNNMHLGTYPDGRPLQPEPEAERALPIIKPELAQIIWDRGVLSGRLEVCGGDWDVMSFVPLMADLKARGDLSPKQLGFAALLHGAAKEQGLNMAEEYCTPGFKASLSATLALSKQLSQKLSRPG